MNLSKNSALQLARYLTALSEGQSPTVTNYMKSLAADFVTHLDKAQAHQEHLDGLRLDLQVLFDNSPSEEA